MSDRPLSHLQLVCRIPKQKLIRPGENDPNFKGMSYNSARDELFLADDNNRVVREIHVRDNVDDLRDVYRGTLHDTSPNVSSVCHMSDSDTLIVCSKEKGPDQKVANWLVALRRNGSEWREAQRVQTEGEGWICCALTDSRVLIGQYNSTYMELFRVEGGSIIERACIRVSEKYDWFSTRCNIDTLVAKTYPFTDQSVRVYRLRGDQLEELSRIQLNYPRGVLWLADRFLVTDWDNEKKSLDKKELEMIGTRFTSCKLIATSEKIVAYRWCAVDDALAMFDWNSKDLTTHLFKN